ncbi:MAG: AtpZ/AtpI family protein [Tepidisphaeraceae bacterium]
MNPSTDGPDDKQIKHLREKYGLDSRPDDSVATSAVGMELAMIVVACGLIGWGLDKWLHTAPWCLLVCCLLGVFGGLYRLIVRFVR